MTKKEILDGYVKRFAREELKEVAEKVEKLGLEFEAQEFKNGEVAINVHQRGKWIYCINFEHLKEYITMYLKYIGDSEK